MGTKTSRQQWVLPDPVDPLGRVCMILQVPDSREHLAALRGALLSLGAAYNWANDEDHTAKDVALLWQDILGDMDVAPCGFPNFATCGYDFNGGELSWTLVPGANQGFYTPGVGWEEQDFGTHNRGAIYITKSLPTPTVLTNFSVSINASAPGSGANNSVILYVDYGAGQQEISRVPLLAGINTYSWSGELFNIVTLWISTNSGDTPSDMVLFQAEYSGFTAEEFDCV